VYRKNCKMGFCIALTFTIQYSFYPGVILGTELTFFKDFSWFVITVVTFHSFWDTIGRFVAGSWNFIPKEWFLAASVSRLIFVVLYILTFDGANQAFFGSDSFVIILFLFFSVSCGYLSTLGMNYGSDDTTGNQSLAGSIMGFHLTFGIVLGSTVALLFFSGKK
jgi:hypothetical protein